MGVLRALHEKGVIEKLSHISGVSGGGWATSIFIYNQTSTIDELLETERTVYAKKPSKITVKSLDEIAPTALASPCTHKLVDDFAGGTLAAAMNPFYMYQDVWIDTTWKTFLKPFGIKRNLGIAASEAHAAHCAEKTGWSKDAFCVPNTSYPVPVMVINNALYGPSNAGFVPCTGIKEHLELIVASNHKANELKSQNPERTMTSCALEAREQHKNVALVCYHTTPYAFDTGYEGPAMQATGCAHSIKVDSDPVKPYEMQPISHSVRSFCGEMHQRRLSLEFMVGAGWGLGLFTGPGGYLNRIKATFQPEMKLHKCKTPVIWGDMGVIENTGVVALLKKGAKSVVSWLSFWTEYDVESPNVDEVLSLFGMTALASKSSIMAQNQVFPSELWPSVAAQFARCRKAGEPLVAILKKVPVLDNPFYGTPAFPGQEVDVCFFVLERPQKWIDKLDPGVLEVQGIAQSQGDRPFPFIKTMFDNGDVINYNPAQIQLLSDLACWSVLHSWKKVGPFFK